FHVAVSGRPGPVVLGLPEDMLSEPAEVPDRPRVEPVRQCFDAAAAEAVGTLLADAERPLVIVGGPRWNEQAARDLAAFAGAWDLPVAVPFRRQDRLDNRHPSYIGDLNFAPNPALARRVAEADVVLALGTRLGDIVTGGYTRIDPLTEPATSGRRLIHIHADPDEPGKVFHADLAFAAPADVAVAALARLAPPAGGRRWARWRAEARADYERWLEPVRLPGELQLGEVIRWLSENLPEDAIVTNGAGNYAGFLHRHFQFRRFGQQLAPTSGSMGYGLPAAIAAALTRPGRQIVCLAGDGCMQMTMNEMSTARQYGARLVALVVNNGIYGTIRMHQERRFPGRVIGSDLANPDWPALARAQGWHGARVTRTADFPAAFAEAAACDGPALIELVLDPEALTPGRTLAQIRAEALAARGEGRSG
ncbi:MAG: thiamine pyrophosphate-binding protein, partial [Alphaproteobacteria bacterium]